MKEQVLKAIEELQEFLECDMPSKVFPTDRITGETLFREDYFQSKKEIEDYIKKHFKILIKQIKEQQK